MISPYQDQMIRNPNYTGKVPLLCNIFAGMMPGQEGNVEQNSAYQSYVPRYSGAHLDAGVLQLYHVQC